MTQACTLATTWMQPAGQQAGRGELQDGGSGQLRGWGASLRWPAALMRAACHTACVRFGAHSEFYAGRSTAPCVMCDRYSEAGMHSPKLT